MHFFFIRAQAVGSKICSMDRKPWNYRLLIDPTRRSKQGVEIKSIQSYCRADPVWGTLLFINTLNIIKHALISLI